MSNPHDATAAPKIPAKRPLRTYSKRSQPESDGDSEPVAKKRRVDMRKEEKAREQAPVAEAPKLPSPPPKGATRGPSIMDYFRPVPSSSSSRTVTSKLSSDIEQLASPPLSSSPVSVNKRVQNGNPVPGGKKDDDSTSSENPADGNYGTVEETQDIADGEASDTEEGGLRECGDSILNRRLPLGRNRDKPRKKPKASRKKKMTVQTTLSLTMNANFTECKECNILYNPYHEEDAKIHARRHAAIIRRKNRT